MYMYIGDHFGSYGLIQQVNQTAPVKLQFVLERRRREIYVQHAVGDITFCRITIYSRAHNIGPQVAEPLGPGGVTHGVIIEYLIDQLLD